MRTKDMPARASFLIGISASLLCPAYASSESPICAVLDDCGGDNPCTMRIHAVGYWRHFRAALTPEALNDLVERGDANFQVILDATSTRKALEQACGVRLILDDREPHPAGFRLSLEITDTDGRRRGFAVTPTGEVFDGEHYYRTREESWPKSKLLDVGRFVYRP